MSEWGYGGENGNECFIQYSQKYVYFLKISPQGPSCWHMVDDGVFSISLTGTRQSPINIETDKNVIETDEALDDLEFEYVPANSTQVCFFIC